MPASLGIAVRHFIGARMPRRFITLFVICTLAASVLAPSAEASIGCNAPNLVPASEAPHQWALLAPAFCIHRTTQRVLSPYDIVAARMKGYYWCFAWAQKPSTPAGAILNWFTAASFCSSRAWYYVQVIT